MFNSESTQPIDIRAWRALLDQDAFAGFDEASVTRIQKLFIRDTAGLAARVRVAMLGTCRDLEAPLHNLKSSTGYLRNVSLQERCIAAIAIVRTDPDGAVTQHEGLVELLDELCRECDGLVSRLRGAPGRSH